MATSKTLTPTNVTIQIPEFTDQPDQRVNSNCLDKEADAINALNTAILGMAHITSLTVATGTRKIKGLSSGDIIIFTRNGSGVYAIADNATVSTIVAGNGITDLSFASGELTFTRTSQYSGGCTCIARNPVTLVTQS